MRILEQQANVVAFPTWALLLLLEATMRVALYARVSTSEQDETLQLPRLREFAARAGWEIYKEYTDSATGTTYSRPGWQALMSDARGRFFDRILIVKLDRMMRSVAFLLEELEDLTRHEVQVYVLDIGLIDMKSPGSRLTLTILGAIAEWEAKVISERTKDGLRARKERGQKLGRPRAKLPIHTIALYRIDKHTYKEISQKLGIPISTIQNYRAEINAEMIKILYAYPHLHRPTSLDKKT